MAYDNSYADIDSVRIRSISGFLIRFLDEDENDRAELSFKAMRMPTKYVGTFLTALETELDDEGYYDIDRYIQGPWRTTFLDVIIEGDIRSLRSILSTIAGYTRI